MESLLGSAPDVTVADHSIAAERLVCRHHTPRVASYERPATNCVSTFRNLARRLELHFFRIGRVLVYFRSIDAPWCAL